MHDPSMITGAAILLAGVIAGRLIPPRRRQPRAPQPVCGCGHHYSYHDAAGSACHASVYQGLSADERYVQCTCRRYAGPEPLPEYYAPEIAP